MAYVGLTIVGMRLAPFAVKLWLSWGVGCVLVLALIWAATIVLQASHLTRRSKTNGSVKWTASEDGLTLEEKNATVSVKWPAFMGFVDTKRLFLIRLKERRTYFIIPKRCLPAPLEPELSNLFSQHLARITA